MCFINEVRMDEISLIRIFRNRELSVEHVFLSATSVVKAATLSTDCADAAPSFKDSLNYAIENYLIPVLVASSVWFVRFSVYSASRLKCPAKNIISIKVSMLIVVNMMKNIVALIIS